VGKKRPKEQILIRFARCLTRTTLLILLPGALALLLAVSVASIAMLRNSAAYISFSCGLVLLAFVLTISIKRGRRSFAGSLQRPLISTAPSVKYLKDAAHRVAEEYPAEVIKIFMETFAGQGSLLQVEEKVDVGLAAIELERTAHFVVPKDVRESVGADALCLLCVAYLNKTVNRSEISLRQLNDESVRLVSMNETHGLIVLAVTALFNMAYGDSGSDLHRERIIETTRWAALEVVISGLGGVEVVTRILKSLEKVTPENPAFADRLGPFLATLAHVTPIVVTSRVSPRITIRYAMRLRVYQAVRSRKSLGAFRRRYIISLSGTQQSKEYTAHFQVPDDQYISSYSLSDLRSGGLISSLDLDEVHGESHVEVTRLNSPSEVVVSSRNLHGMTNLAAELEVKEIPPGVLGRVTLLAGVAMLLIMFITLVQPGLLSQHSGQSGGGAATDLPALLLALPAFVSSWLGYSLSDSTKISTPIAARIGYRMILVLSCASVLLYVAQIGGFLSNTITSIAFMPHIFILRHLSISWVVLLSAAALILSYLSISLRMELQAYRLYLRSSLDAVMEDIPSL
jgi:hypothetical protein